MYTLDNIESLLLQENIMDVDAIVFGDYEVTSTNRRNCNLQITTLHHGNYLVKQVLDANAANAQTLVHEMLMYEYVHENIIEAKKYFPALVFTNKTSKVLIVNFFTDAIPLWKYYKQQFQQYGIDKMPLQTVAEAAKLLATLHNIFSSKQIHNDDRLSFLPTSLPFIFNLHKPAPAFLSYATQGAYTYIAKLQADNALIQHIEQMSASWQINALIHGDVKLDNFLVLQPDSVEESTQLKLIDWEMAQYGDIAWDIASALQDFIFWWAIMMPNEDTAELMMQRAPFGLDKLKPAMAIYWNSYTNALQADAKHTKDFYKKVIQLVGLRCLQTAYEISSKFDGIPPIATILLNIGKEIIKNPKETSVLLTGIACE